MKKQKLPHFVLAYDVEDDGKLRVMRMYTPAEWKARGEPGKGWAAYSPDGKGPTDIGFTEQVDTYGVEGAIFGIIATTSKSVGEYAIQLLTGDLARLGISGWDGDGYAYDATHRQMLKGLHPATKK